MLSSIALFDDFSVDAFSVDAPCLSLLYHRFKGMEAWGWQHSVSKLLFCAVVNSPFCTSTGEFSLAKMDIHVQIGWRGPLAEMHIHVQIGRRGEAPLAKTDIHVQIGQGGPFLSKSAGEDPTEMDIHPCPQPEQPPGKNRHPCPNRLEKPLWPKWTSTSKSAGEAPLAKMDIHVQIGQRSPTG